MASPSFGKNATIYHFKLNLRCRELQSRNKSTTNLASKDTKIQKGVCQILSLFNVIQWSQEA
jgi:hypothetical protein